MSGAFYIGAAGLKAQESGLDAVANNIANINTPGFKRTDVRFAELVISPALAPDGSVDASKPRPGLAGVRADATGRIMDQGELRATGKPMDVAISGAGYVEVLGPNGQALLWRGGSLTVNADGYLATGDGLALKALIRVPETQAQLTIGRDGIVSATGADGVKQELGRIELVMPRPADAMVPTGDGFYLASDSEGLTRDPGEDGAGAIVQGSLEQSNVQLSDEMVTLLLLQRAYSANAQVVQAGDQLMSIANGLRR